MAVIEGGDAPEQLRISTIHFHQILVDRGVYHHFRLNPPVLQLNQRLLHCRLLRRNGMLRCRRERLLLESTILLWVMLLLPRRRRRHRYGDVLGCWVLPVRRLRLWRLLLLRGLLLHGLSMSSRSGCLGHGLGMLGVLLNGLLKVRVGRWRDF